MAMIKCYECNSDVSELADTYPNCGAPTEAVLRAEDKIRRSTDYWNNWIIRCCGVLKQLCFMVFIRIRSKFLDVIFNRYNSVFYFWRYKSQATMNYTFGT